MEYSLRRYEAFQGLTMLLFLLVCLMAAYPMHSIYLLSHDAPVAAGEATSYQSFDFWMQPHWMQQGPLGSIIVYLGWFGTLFVIGRFFWVVLQYVGKHMAANILTEAGGNTSSHSPPSLDALISKPERLFRADLVRRNADRFPHCYIFHPFQRLLLMLPAKPGAASSEDMLDKERRMVEMDWQFLHSSWFPFRWLLWLLPLLAFIQSGALLYGRIQPILTEGMSKGGGDGLDAVNLPLIFLCFTPLMQVALLSAFLSFGSAVQKRLESLYLSGVDALFYDKLLSRLPFQSSDTPILLAAMRQFFKEINERLDHIENAARPR